MLKSTIIPNDPIYLFSSVWNKQRKDW
jgi:hypothetical protein